MTNSEWSAADLTARATELNEVARQLAADVAERREATQAARQEALAVTGSAASPDGSVRVTSDVGGMPTALELSPTAQRVPPQRLASLVLDTCQRAAAQARAAAREKFDQLGDRARPADVPLLLPVSPSPAPAQRQPQSTEDDFDGPRDSWLVKRRRSGQ